MILTDTAAIKKKRIRLFSMTVLGLLALVICFSFFKSDIVQKAFIDYQEPDLPAYVILCDAETVEEGNFLTAGYTFHNGQTQSSDYAHSGNYSSKLGESDKMQFGITYNIKKYKLGDMFKISIWRYRPNGGGDGRLVVSDNKKFYQEESFPTTTDEKGWDKIEFYINAPAPKGNLNVYVYTNGGSTVYFDDLRIEKIVAENSFVPEHLNIELKDKHLKKIQNKRTEAISAGLLETGEKDWAKARLISDQTDQDIPIELRLKGDWLDHLRTDKWSFRIKTKEPYAWNRLMTFSVQTPAAREYLHEWILHKLWEKEDVLTTRYDFIKLSLNGKSLGIYAFEEHFEKQLVEYKNRREGPIVRFSEDAFWASLKRQLEHIGSELNYSLPQPEKKMENAAVRPFKEGKTLKSPVLMKQFEAAQSLMNQYMSRERKAADIFDLDLMAKYFVICDVMGAYHGLVWHNQRFYYNPVTSKLEPVGYDGFPIIPKYASSFMGNGSLNKNFRNGTALYQQLFQQEDFYLKYIKYLKQFTDKKYIDDFLSEIRPELEKRLNSLKTEFPFYKFNETDIIKRAQRIHLQLLPLPDASLRAFRQSPIETKGTLKISNLHGLPLAVIGTGRKTKTMDYQLEKPLILPGYQNRYMEDKYTDFELEQPANYLFYKTLGLDSIFSTAIINWKINTESTGAQTLFAKANESFSNPAIASNNIFTVSDSLVYFHTGIHRTDEDIVIPEGYKVDFAPGATIDFVKGAKFISRSAVTMLGEEDAPIKIISSDGSGGGFTILQAKEKSILRKVIVENFNTLKHQDWQLTGAVSFYESDVEIYNSVFTKNNCEDGLNIVRSKFLLDQVIVSETFSDGLDVDFGDGRILNSNFINTGNDGVDFSGSKIYLANCFFDHCGDKGISVGEETTATIASATVQNAVIGVASKDLSKLTIENINLKNCQLGFTAYQKKPEFGGSRINVYNYTAEEVKYLYKIPPGSVLKLKGNLVN